MKNENLSKIGNNIQLARIEKGLTQESLAEICNVSANYISNIERGKASGSISLILDICNTLDLSPNYIFNGTVNTSNDYIDIIPSDIVLTYQKLKDENKKFTNQTIKHLYAMQNKR